jgi:hypothetical protein
VKALPRSLRGPVDFSALRRLAAICFSVAIWVFWTNEANKTLFYLQLKKLAKPIFRSRRGRGGAAGRAQPAAGFTPRACRRRGSKQRDGVRVPIPRFNGSMRVRSGWGVR